MHILPVSGIHRRTKPDIALAVIKNPKIGNMCRTRIRGVEEVMAGTGIEARMLSLCRSELAHLGMWPAGSRASVLG